MKVHIASDSTGTTSSIEAGPENQVDKQVESRSTSVACRETADHLELEIDMPGISVRDLDVSLTGRRLAATYASESEEKSVDEDGTQRSVKSKQTLKQEVDLPTDVDPRSADAVYKRGILFVKLRKMPIDSERGDRVVVKVK